MQRIEFHPGAVSQIRRQPRIWRYPVRRFAGVTYGVARLSRATSVATGPLREAHRDSSWLGAWGGRAGPYEPTD